MTSGPDLDATGTASGVDNDPRVYVMGGSGETDTPLKSCLKYNPNIDQWIPIADLPIPLAN